MKNKSSRSFFSIGITLFLPLAAFAADPVLGTPDLDGDGDGDPVGNYNAFLLDGLGENINTGDPQQQTFYGASSLPNTQWWVSSQNQDGWVSYLNDSESGKFPTAHLLDPVGAGDSFWISVTFGAGNDDYHSLFRESNGVIPAGTHIYFALATHEFDAVGSAYRAPGGYTLDSVRGTDNLTFIDSAAPTIAEIDETQWNWFHYSVDELNKDVVWDIKPEDGSALLTDWFAYFQLPSGAGINGGLAGTEWDLSGYNDKGQFVSVTPGETYYLTAADGLAKINPQVQDPTTDAVFSWTVHSGNDTYGNMVPEPSAALLFGVFLTGALMVRRRRNAR